MVRHCGYIDARLLVDGRNQYAIDLVGFARLDVKWQAQAGEGFAATDFKVDWPTKQVICPRAKPVSK